MHVSAIYAPVDYVPALDVRTQTAVTSGTAGRVERQPVDVHGQLYFHKTNIANRA